ncbi:MAG: hypothetical protein Kow0013_28090 [Pararhodobacter sp.]
MSQIVEASIADFLPPDRRTEFVNCSFVGPEHVLKQVAFTVGKKSARPPEYRIEVSNPDFRGKLHFLLGPGKGVVRIESGGPMNVSFRMYRNCNVQIEEGVTITQARIVCDDADIHVGRNGLWSDEIIVQSNDQHGIIDLQTMAPINSERRSITIAEHVWIGRRAIIMPDVHIGREAIIAAGACVTSDVERNSIYAGIPPRRIREGITWSRSPTGLSDYERRLLGYDQA